MKRSKRLQDFGADPQKWADGFIRAVYVHAAAKPSAEDTERFTLNWFADAIRAGRNAERALLQQQTGTEN